jgi:hypothetical protein
LSTHLRLGLPSGLFRSGFPTNKVYLIAFIILFPWILYGLKSADSFSCQEVTGEISVHQQCQVSEIIRAGHGSRRLEPSSLARKPGSWVRIPLRAWMFGMCVCFLLCSCCPELITRPRSPIVCNIIKKLRNQPYALKWEQEEGKKDN